ncbi:MAG TPA: DUF2934 domain-containing protein [Candidatus Dormibacteraeota bacterium]|nr:DUF2934 domain-containing protein [Candidatus Dormibacteraeota bacterium]
MAKSRTPKKANGDIALPPVETASTALPTAEASAPDTKPEPRRSSRKPSIVRSDPRATVVPINLEEEIRRLAYLLAERRGFEPGHEAEDWLIAEREIQQRYHQHSA